MLAELVQFRTEFGNEQIDRRARGRRANAVLAADAVGGAGFLFALRRRRSEPYLGEDPRWFQWRVRTRAPQSRERCDVVDFEAVIEAADERR